MNILNGFFAEPQELELSKIWAQKGEQLFHISGITGCMGMQKTIELKGLFI